MESTFGTALLGSIGVRHVGIARSMPDDMNTNDPLKTSESFGLVSVLNFKFPKIFSSASELQVLYVFWRVLACPVRVLALRGPKPPVKVESTQSNRVPSTVTGTRVRVRCMWGTNRAGRS